MMLIRILNRVRPSLSRQLVLLWMNLKHSMYFRKSTFLLYLHIKKERDIILSWFCVVYTLYTVPNNYSGYLSNKLYHWKLTADDIPVLIITFYAPLGKGGILFCNCRSVGRSVGWLVCRSVCRPSVVRSISIDPSLDQYQTWFSGHMFKGQGQTTLLSPVCCPLYIF